MPDPRPGRRRPGRGGALAALSVLGVLVLAAGGVVIWRAAHPPRPDLAAFMRAGAVRGNERLAARRINGVLARLQRLTWLEQAGMAISDGCSYSGQGGGDALFAPRPAGVRCARLVTGIYAFDGPLPARELQVEAALQTAGVTGLAACSASGQAPVRCGTWPGMAGVASVAAAGVAPLGAKISLSWIRRGQPVAPWIALGWTSGKAASGSYRSYQGRSVDLSSAARRSLAAHQDILLVLVSAQYYAARPGASPPP